MMVKSFLWMLLVSAVVGLSYSSEYSIIPSRLLPFRWAVSLTPVGLLQGAIESDPRNLHIVQKILSAPANRPGFGDVAFLWIWGVLVALLAASILFAMFIRRDRE
jgi:hypothetical protein